MNRFFLFSLAVGLTLFSVSCEDEEPLVPVDGTADVTEFDRVTVSDNIDLNITQGNEYSVTVQGGASIDEVVNADYTDGTLDISGLAILQEATIDIVMPQIRSLESTGSGAVSISNFNELTILDVKTEGSGLVTITNSTVEFAELTTRRVGQIDAFDLMATAARCEILGTRDISITIESQLNGGIFNNGNINYKGFPTDIAVSRSGNGQVVDAN